MANELKLKNYEANMAANAVSAVEICNLVKNSILHLPCSVTPETLHNGWEYWRSNAKSCVEQNDSLTDEQKEYQKAFWDQVGTAGENLMKDQLMREGRLAL